MMPVFIPTMIVLEDQRVTVSELTWYGSELATILGTVMIMAVFWGVFRALARGLG